MNSPICKSFEAQGVQSLENVQIATGPDVALE